MIEEQNPKDLNTLPSGSVDSIHWEFFDPNDPNEKRLFEEKVFGNSSGSTKGISKQPKVKRHPGSGNYIQETPGLLRISKKCKICKSQYRNEITMDLLGGMTYHGIIAKWKDKIYLNPVNINSHRKHCDPRMVAKIDANKRELSLVDFSPAVMKLYQQKYDETLNKVKTVNLLYDARLRNLWELLSAKKHIEDKKKEEKTELDKLDLHKLTVAIDEIMKGLTKDLLTHIKIEQGPGVTNVNILMVQNFRDGIEKFIEDFVDVLVQEIEDPLTRDRVRERFVEKLDERISPLLDPKMMVTADAKIVDNENEE